MSACASLVTYTLDSLEYTLFEYTANETFTGTHSANFNLNIPSSNASIPSLTIPSYPNINLGCNTCTSKAVIPICDMGYLKQQIPCGVDCEGNILYCTITVPTGFQKCFNEVTFNTVNIPSLNLFTLPQFTLNYDMQFITSLSSSQTFQLINEISIEAPEEPSIKVLLKSYKIQSYSINTLVVNQLSFQLSNFSMAIGDFTAFNNTVNIKGFNFTLPTITLNPIQYFIQLLNKELGTNISDSVNLLDLLSLTGPNKIIVTAYETIVGGVVQSTLQAQVQVLTLPAKNIQVNGQTYNTTIVILFFPFIIFVILDIIANEEAKHNPNNQLLQELKNCLNILNDKTNVVFQDLIEYTELEITFYFLYCPNPSGGAEVLNMEVTMEISFNPYNYYKNYIPTQADIENKFNDIIKSSQIPITKETTYLGLNPIIDAINLDISSFYVFTPLIDALLEGARETCLSPVSGEATYTLPLPDE